MDGSEWRAMIIRLQDKGITDYTDGDIIAEYEIYCAELEKQKEEQQQEDQDGQGV